MLTLTEGEQVSIGLSSYGYSGDPEISPTLTGNYFIVGELAFRDGTEDVVVMGGESH